MKKYLVSLLFFIISIFYGLEANEPAPYTLGREWLQEIKTDYESKKYDAFLEELDEGYQSYLNLGLMNIEEALDSSKDLTEKLINQKADEIKQRSEKLKLLEERNQSLMKIASSYPDEFVSKIIEEIVQLSHSSGSSTDYKNFIYGILAKREDPDSQAQKCWDVMKTFIAKYQIIKMGCVRHKKLSQDLDQIGDEKKYHVILALNHISMLAGVEQQMKDTLLLWLSNFVDKQIIAHDEEYLNRLGNGTLSPANQAEFEVKKIMQNYQGK